MPSWFETPGTNMTLIRSKAWLLFPCDSLGSTDTSFESSFRSLNMWGYWLRVNGPGHPPPSTVLGKNSTQNTPITKGKSVSSGHCGKDPRAGISPSPETHPSPWDRCYSWGSRHCSSPASGFLEAAASPQTTQRRVCPGTASRSISVRARDHEASSELTYGFLPSPPQLFPAAQNT